MEDKASGRQLRFEIWTEDNNTFDWKASRPIPAAELMILIGEFCGHNAFKHFPQGSSMEDILEYHLHYFKRAFEEQWTGEKNLTSAN